MRTRTALPTLLAISLLVLAGCGDDKPSDGSGSADADMSVKIDETPSDTPSSEPTSDVAEPDGEPAEVLEELLQAYTDNDADTACSLQTERYTKDAITEGIKENYVKNGATCADFVTVASGFAKAFEMDPSKAQYIELSNDGQTAKIRFIAEGSDQTYMLINTDGQWLLDQELD